MWRSHLSHCIILDSGNKLWLAVPHLYCADSGCCNPCDNYLMILSLNKINFRKGNVVVDKQNAGEQLRDKPNRKRPQSLFFLSRSRPFYRHNGKSWSCEILEFLYVYLWSRTFRHGTYYEHYYIAQYEKIWNAVLGQLYCKLEIKIFLLENSAAVRHVTGNDQDYLRKIPRVVVQKSALL